LIEVMAKMNRVVSAFFLVLIASSFVLGAEVSRITQLLHFLNANVGSEPGGTSPKLHTAYYGAETLDTLSKHAGYIQKSLLGTEDYLFKLGTFVSLLQVTTEADPEYGGFQAFSGEKKEVEYSADKPVCTVGNSFFAGRVIEVGSSRLGGGEDHFKRVDASAALTFLAKSRRDGVYVTHPAAKEPTVSAIFYGSQAWNIFSRHTKDTKLEAANADNTLKFLKGLYEAGGFKHDAKAKEADLRSTYQAIVALKNLKLWDSFNTNRKDTVEQIKKFVSSYQDSKTSAFGNAPGAPADIASTYLAVGIAKELGLESILDDKAITSYIGSLQNFHDGGFRLRPTGTSGHYANTFHAIQTLERLGTMNLLEDTMRQQDRIVYIPQFIPNAAFYLVIVLALTLFAGALYLVTRGSGKDEEEEEEAYVPERKKSEGEKKIRKKEATITIIRNNTTKECVDKDGEPFPIDTLDRKEWEILSSEDKGDHTVYILRKREGKKDPGTPLRKRSKGRK